MSVQKDIQIKILERRWKQLYCIAAILGVALFMAGYLLAMGELFLAVLPITFWVVVHLYLYLEFRKI